MDNLKKLVEKRTNGKSQKDKAIEFIAAGVGCNCLVSLFNSGILEILIKDDCLTQKEIEECSNPICVQAALVTLQKCDIVKKSGNNFKITKFGRAIYEYIGLIVMVFDGYGDLMTKQNLIIEKKIRKPERLIRGEAVSQSAVLLSQSMIDPILLNEFENLKFSGTICDLGCGYGRMLSKVCQKTGNPGLGFDSESSVVEQAKKQLEDSLITIEYGDISSLEGIWEDVVILMQCHVFHDFPKEKCISIMNAYLSNFPRLKYFFFIDTVTPSSDENQILPGFDYVHGLLGILTRNYQETIHMFDQSEYQMLKEVPIPNIPNTYLWVLSPKKLFKDM